MGDELFDHILKLVNDTPWPENPFVNAKSQHIFEMGMDVLNLYRGHPQILVDALSVFYQTDSRPYAYAGIAAVLIGAAYSHGDIYEETGLQKAQRWLEQAQALVPDRLEINLVEVSLYRAWQQNDNARILLDYFQQENYEHFFLSTAEMGYWGAVHNIPKCYEWYRHAMNLADRPHRKLYANNTMGGIYLTNKCYTHAIDAYKRVAKINPEDPWLWHNMSIAHIQLKEYREAEVCNKKALSLMEFGAAQNVKAALEKLKASRRY